MSKNIVSLKNGRYDLPLNDCGVLIVQILASLDKGFLYEQLMKGDQVLLIIVVLRMTLVDHGFLSLTFSLYLQSNNFLNVDAAFSKLALDSFIQGERPHIVLSLLPLVKLDCVLIAPQGLVLKLRPSSAIGARAPLEACPEIEYLFEVGLSVDCDILVLNDLGSLILLVRLLLEFDIGAIRIDGHDELRHI